mmetsp:Transcript_94995/g.165846  ORF Transcript_94995/g.165846 Transcript_94995/m.165846 type:complete len:94 (+) Transcript_94995:104-385(+)
MDGMMDNMKAGARGLMEGGLEGAKKSILEETIKKAEDSAGEMAPGYVKPCFGCCGGPVETLKTFEFVVPADKKDEFNKSYTGYKEAKEKLKTM